MQPNVKLTKVKLAGFKSFADPTTLHFEHNIAAILGPNGCGKSNVIDAVRWVMGESSAKQLRGETMSDVVFNGSSGRRPLGQASVELYFDNRDAHIGGEYAKYSEISLRREVGRDGVSKYYLNGYVCRRRDIADIFYGTGLSNNSYAIIGQGTITAFIEAKPEDLKSYLEDAAGTSKYKDRRRETENRIKHTRENLERLADIRGELEKQLRHLKIQANKAERYKNLQQEERILKAELLALNWQYLAVEYEQTGALVASGETELENKNLELQVIEAKIAQNRESQLACADAYNVVQERYYRMGATISRLEQQINHAKERSAQLKLDLAKNSELLLETSQHKIADEQAIALLCAEKDALTAGLPEQQATLDAVEQQVSAAEQQLAEWQHTWDEFNTESAGISRSIEVEQMRIQHLEQAIVTENIAISKIKNELTSFNFTNLSHEIQLSEGSLADIRNNRERLNAELEQVQSQIAGNREQSDQLATLLSIARSKLQSLSGKQASLEALQAAALSKNNADLLQWLQRSNLQGNSRLLHEIKVVSGWEKAVETVLDTYLEAVCVDNFEDMAGLLEEAPRGELVLFDRVAQNLLSTSAKLPTLYSKIDTSLPIACLLQGIYVADSLQEALGLRRNLEANESVVTKQGVWVGRTWLRVSSDESHNAGVLQREQELRELNELIPAEKIRIESVEVGQQQLLAALAVLEQQYNKLQEELHNVTAAQGTIQGEAHAKQKHMEYLRAREVQLVQEIQTHEIAAIDAEQKLTAGAATLSELLSKKQNLLERRQNILDHRETCQRAVDETRTKLTEVHNLHNTVKMRLELLQNQARYLQQNILRSEKRIADIEGAESAINVELVAVLAPVDGLQVELAGNLEQQLAVANELQVAKQNLSDVEHVERELEQQRASLQGLLQKLRSELENARLHARELQVRSANYQEQVLALGFAIEKIVLENVSDSAVAEYETKIATVSNKIVSLGAINLAAIEEFDELEKRKIYLDEQNQDLVSALEILEQAIQKIDHDTKVKFKETFDSVNRKFQNIFPKIFNGGRAYLELTDTDILQAGVVIFAQPPGKRNATIHLLSGGEKALTAIALIFAIFQLNPAPFCMLDEVDAPLDDSNVVRFCNLVREIASTIQLIFISHNKLTLEMAGQLTGVTMHEPGVSRIVAVNVEEALRVV